MFGVNWQIRVYMPQNTKHATLGNKSLYAIKHKTCHIYTYRKTPVI